MDKFAPHTIVLLRDMFVRIAIFMLGIGFLHTMSWLARSHYITPAQLSFMDCVIVGLNVTPSMLM